MSTGDLEEERIRADILNRLFRRGCWGGRYTPLDTLVNWLSQQIERKYKLRDGRRIRKAVKDLLNEGFLWSHKGGRAISLNPRRSREIVEYIERFMKS